nr:amidase family protein [Micromonospora sp. DSM 115978]
MVDAQIRPDDRARRQVTTAPLDLQATVLHRAYLDGSTTVTAVVEASYARIAARRAEAAATGTAGDAVWITLVPLDIALQRAGVLDALLAQVRDGHGSLPPLFGLPFAVKDNIDVAGYPTTAGCEAFTYRPSSSAPLVERLVEAGGVLVGKTNLDQFATGLSGARSPYGVPASPFGQGMISGGSSSGSGVAVADGLVTFAIGTDTAGSGRVPA